MSIFGVSKDDTHNVDTQSLSYEETCNVLLCDLYEDVIDNDLDSRPTRPPPYITGRIASRVPFSKRATLHLLQTCKKRILQNGICTNYHISKSVAEYIK